MIFKGVPRSQTPPPNPANVRLAKSTAVRAHTLVIEWDEVPNGESNCGSATALVMSDVMT
jgi:hypothetical protein